MREFSLGLFFNATSVSVYIFLQLELASANDILELSNEVLFSEAKLNPTNTKATRVYLLLKRKINSFVLPW